MLQIEIDWKEDQGGRRKIKDVEKYFFRDNTLVLIRGRQKRVINILATKEINIFEMNDENE